MVVGSKPEIIFIFIFYFLFFFAPQYHPSPPLGKPTGCPWSETVFLHTLKLGLITWITGLNLKYHVRAS